MTERLPRLVPEAQSPAQRALADAIAGGPRAAGPQHFELVGADGALNGPFNAMLIAPGVGGALQALGSAVRYGTGLSGRVREMAILTVAAAWESAFETYAHVPIGRAAGLREQELADLGAGRAPELADPVERVAVGFVRTLLAGGALTDTEYREVESALGAQAVYELTTLVGYYATLALQLRVFAVGVPPGGSTSS